MVIIATLITLSSLLVLQMKEVPAAEYGNTGCRVFKRGVQNRNDFCLKINIPKGNH